MKTTLLIATLMFSLTSNAYASPKFKVGDCLYFEKDTKAGSPADGVTWKIVGILKERYVVRVHGGKHIDSAIKKGLYSQSGWSMSTKTLSFANTDSDGAVVSCPKE